MWHWEQGRTEYFQFFTLQRIARFFVSGENFKTGSATRIREQIGLPFPPEEYHPWRNYSRVFKLCLLVSEDKRKDPVSTEVARLLAQPDAVTCDEYIHFLVDATTDPSPAFSGWSATQASMELRYPLCFALKYIFMKIAANLGPEVPANEIIWAYENSNFTGTEGEQKFQELVANSGRSQKDNRQARESIRFLAQLSYLHYKQGRIFTPLSRTDALFYFHSLHPVPGPRESDANAEIQRLASLFFASDRKSLLLLTESAVSAEHVINGFSEGRRIARKHIFIERNSSLRRSYFVQHPTTICDVCSLDTRKKYPWVPRVLDLHHILPLSAGARASTSSQTQFDDLVPVCPTCHRAVHQYYDDYLSERERPDFLDLSEARRVYHDARNNVAKESCYAQ